MALVSYAGVPLLAVTQETVASIEASISVHDVYEFPETDRGLWPPGCPQRWPDAQDRGIKLGRLHWPVGASRWAVYHGLVSEKRLGKIRPRVYDAGAAGRYKAATFVMGDSLRKITTSLWMLPPRPLQQFKQDNGLYLLTLVDERFFWWQKAALITVDGGTTTWAQLYGDIATALGITITVAAIDAGYLYPSEDLSCRYEFLPPLLDAVASSVGQRIVRRLDGTVLSQSPQAALLLANQQQRKWRRKAGGEFAFVAGR